MEFQLTITVTDEQIESLVKQWNEADGESFTAEDMRNLIAGRVETLQKRLSGNLDWNLSNPNGLLFN